MENEQTFENTNKENNEEVNNNGKEKRRKTFVLDTNVIIHNPNSLFEFEDNRVVLPMKVIEELDKFKTFKDEKGMIVRSVTRTIDDFREKGNLKKGVLLEGGGILQIVANYLPEYKLDSDFDIVYDEEFELMDTSIPDNEIILTALKLQRQKKEKVIFISKDLNSRIKASALGIHVMNYTEKYNIKIEEHYTGHMKLKLESDQIGQIFSEKEGLPIDNFDEDIKEKIYANMYLTVEDIYDENHTAVAKYVKKYNGLKPIKEYNSVWDIEPRNREQNFAFDALMDPKVSLVTLVGRAGTGKTLLALASGLKQVSDDHIYDKLLVARPVIPMGKDIGYLPGSKDEKLHFWMQPIFDNLRFILQQHTSTKYNQKDHHKKKSDNNQHQNDNDKNNNGKPGSEDPDNAIQYLMDSGQLELEALTYIRGRTIPKIYLIVDEAQNLTPHEVKTIISRAGEGTKVVLTGDPYQIDNPYLDASSNGLIQTIEKFKGESVHSQIMFMKSERSKLASLATKLL